MKKFLSLFMTFCLVFALLISCAPTPDDTTNSNTGADDTSDNVGSEITATNLICSSAIPSDVANILYSDITNGLGMNVRLTDDSAAEAEHEIIIGETNRALSQKAYLLLRRIEKSDEDFDNSYIIITDGKSVALAYDENNFGNTYARDDALDALVNDILNDNIDMMFEGEVLRKETINIVERLEAIDKTTSDSEWIKLAEYLGGDEHAAQIVDAIKRYYTLTTDKMITWLANLYDPETGGFYYSNSGRNTIGYAPDIESTEQAFNLLSSSGAMGAIGGTPANMPDWMKESLVKWIKPMQDPNGFFYHPQWGKELGDSRLARLGRDLWRAENLLSWCGAQPTYTTPDGVVGDFTLIDGTKVDKNGTPIAASVLTERLGANRASLVSKIVAQNVITVSSSVPSHLKDESSFLEYLNTFNIKYDSYNVGNEIASQGKMISNREIQLRAEGSSWSIKKTLENWLAENQNPENGMWYFIPKTSEDYSIYDGVNGLLKISDLYNTVGIEFPNPEAAIESAIEGIYTEENPLTVCYTYNTWFSVLNIFKNLETFSTNSAATEEFVNGIRRRLFDDAPNLIEHTRKKVALFAKEDGSFSYYQNRTNHGSMGMPVAVPNVNEGDVNSTLICANSTGSYMFQVLGIIDQLPKLYSGATWYRFLNIIDDIGDVIKDEIKDDPVITFEDYSEGDTPDEIFFDYKFSSGKSVVINNPNGRGKVYRFDSPADGGDRLQIDCTNPLSTNSYIFETDMCIESGGSSGYCIQMVMGDCYMLAFRIVGNRVQIFDTSSASTIKKEVEFGYSVGLDEWFKLRMEYYVGNEDTVRAKVYINNKLIAVSDNYYNHSGTKITTGHATPASVFTFVRISAFSNYNVSMLFDNMAVYKRNDIYEVETNPLNQPVYTVDRPTLDENIFDFESTKSEKDYPDGIEVSEGDGSVTVSENALLLSSGTENGFNVKVSHFIREPGANCDVFETDLTLKSVDDGAKVALKFLSSDYTETEVLGLLLEARKSGDNCYLAFLSYPDGTVGDAFDGIKIAQGETVKIKVEYYSDAKAALIYLNGKLLAFVDKVSAGAGSYDIGKLDITDLASGNISLSVDNIKLDREIRDFKTATTPDVDRVTHEFEATDDSLTVSSGSILDGVLSLNAGGSVSVPLNPRSVAINTVLLSLDIKINEASEGKALKISLLSSEGDVVLSYLIKKSESHFALHELTKNGSYGAVAVLSLADGENLTLEYFRGAGQVNIYLGDKCVMVSSLTYSESSAALLPATAKIEATAATILDNIVYEGYAKLLETPGISAKIPEADKADFESSGKGMLHEALTVTDFTQYTVKESLIGSSYTKILEFITTRGNKDAFSIGLTSENSEKKITAFETKIYVRHDGGSSSYSYTVALKNRDGADAYRFTFRIGDAGMQMWDLASTNGEIKVIAKRDTWFTLKVEYYHEEGKVLTYVDGNVVYNSTNLCSAITDKISLVSFTADEGLNATLFLDDMSLREIAESETPDSPDVENSEDGAEMLTFETSATDNLPNALTTSLANANSSILIEELVRSETNKKVMTFKTVKGNKDEIRLSLTKAEENTNAFVFESDLYIQHDGSSSSYSFTVNLLDKNGTSAYKFILRIGDAGMQMQDVGITTGDLKVIATRDAWFTFRLEFLIAEGKVLTYVNENLVYESTNLTGYSVSEIAEMSFVPDEGLNATVKFDNMSLAQKTVEIIEDDEKVEEEAGPVLGFENGAISSKITYLSGAQVSPLSVVEKTVENEVSKVLRFYTTKGYGESISIGLTADTPDSYNATVFEADVFMNNAGGSAYSFDVFLTNESGSHSYMQTLRMGSGITIQMCDSSSTSTGDTGMVRSDETHIANRDQWFKLRIEYYHGDRDNVKILTYVNGNLVYTSTNFYGYRTTDSSRQPNGNITQLRFSPYTNTQANVYFDNISLYQTTIVEK